MKRALCWLRRDLRLCDHTALHRATESADVVFVVFVYDTKILAALPDKDDRRVTFIHQSVEDVAESLRQVGSSLLTLYGDPVEEVPQLALDLKAETVFAAHDDDPYALRRDAEVRGRLAGSRIGFETVKDHVVFERREIVTDSGQPYKVFTPYCRAWRSRLSVGDVAEQPVDVARFHRAREDPAGRAVQGNRELSQLGFVRSELWLAPGERGARRQLDGFTALMKDYASQRDYPARSGTSGLSVHLRHGTVSVRACVRRALEQGSEGATKWLNEIVWREFYHMVLSTSPRVVDKAFRSEFDAVSWPGDLKHYQAWERGQTGYPIVDAAMRCLHATGWMHNRLRMVAAMFLTKDLLLDYRLGEAWFARKLLDFELASNNGGWQWSASTGADAQPWFRIFNPVTQSQRFDPEGTFIREWCPELAGLSEETVHWPLGCSPFERAAAGVSLGIDYPEPIVDHSRQRSLALTFLKRVTAAKAPDWEREPS